MFPAGPARTILNGMTGEVEINGDTYRNVMAPHSDLTDQQIADVLTYVRANFGGSGQAGHGCPSEGDPGQDKVI